MTQKATNRIELPVRHGRDEPGHDEKANHFSLSGRRRAKPCFIASARFEGTLLRFGLVLFAGLGDCRIVKPQAVRTSHAKKAAQ
jgi:hypothetical protein